MGKRSFIKPAILMDNGWGGDGSETGAGSAGTSDDLTFVDFTEWQEMYGNGGTVDEYIQWWVDNEFPTDDEELWYLLNPGIDFPWP